MGLEGTQQLGVAVLLVEGGNRRPSKSMVLRSSPGEPAPELPAAPAQRGKERPKIRAAGRSSRLLRRVVGGGGGVPPFPVPGESRPSASVTARSWFIPSSLPRNWVIIEARSSISLSAFHQLCDHLLYLGVFHKAGDRLWVLEDFCNLLLLLWVHPLCNLLEIAALELLAQLLRVAAQAAARHLQQPVDLFGAQVHLSHHPFGRIRYSLYRLCGTVCPRYLHENGAGVIVGENFGAAGSLPRHKIGAVLAHPHPMAVALRFDGEGPAAVRNFDAA